MRVVSLTAVVLLGSAAADEGLRWGTYHSGLYFGVRSRTTPAHVSAGLLWTSANEDVSQLHHECTERDRFESYGWTKHDGRRFGQQTIRDRINRLALETTFLKPPEPHGAVATKSWAARIAATPLYPEKGLPEATSLFFYVDAGCGDDDLGADCRADMLRHLRWSVDDPDTCMEPTAPGVACLETTIRAEHATEPLYNFQTRLQAHFKGDTAEMLYWGDAGTNVVNVKDRLVQLAQRVRADPEILLPNDVDDDSSVVVVQMRFDPRRVSDVVLHVVHQEDDAEVQDVTPVVVYDEVIADYARAFDARFEAAFALSQATLQGNPLTADAQRVAQAAFSSLIGGIGYFYGSIFLETEGSVGRTAPTALYSAVPSRSFFPRGFLWDEGFHQLGIAAFDPTISMQVLDHWLQTMDADGYMAREQIRGQLAQKRVPAEFVVQHASHANPPTLLLAVEKLARLEVAAPWLREAWPKLVRWFEWFQKTQSGSKPHSFRWRGRHDDGRLMPNTLASGLDDYPRASVPGDDERHVDLLSWMAKASNVLAKVATAIGQDATKYTALYTTYLAALETYHWHDGLYLDYGTHSADGLFVDRIVIRGIDATASQAQLQRRDSTGLCPPSHPRYLYPLGDGAGGLLKKQVFEPKTVRRQFVRHIGYVTFFPLFLKLLPVDSEKLLPLLTQMETHLLSPFGLRSLAPSDEYYDRPNAPGDAPYWRGAIWINLNYLALESLQHYAAQAADADVRAAFAATYARLREVVVGTIVNEYKVTGYFHEQYNDKTGKGQRCHPFTGWTALVVNILAEAY
uniref:Mannosyl-oligosaccharide glucosidase n=1 Tax=Achlya hypogyna TaxID=1202772 RepID=A0A0A7CNP2_ACHHY|nr:secreted protein [Achlya hypogyna]